MFSMESRHLQTLSVQNVLKIASQRTSLSKFFPEEQEPETP